MTNTESRIAIGLEELAPWDAEGVEKDERLITEANICEPFAYDFDSDKKTLVGLGPVERAHRFRKDAEVPDSQRMPQSEPPGPFIAPDDEDDALPAVRRPRLAAWVVALPVTVVIASVAVAVVRGLAPGAPTTRKPPVAAVGPQATVFHAPAPQIESSANEPREIERLDVARPSSSLSGPVAPPANVVAAAPNVAAPAPALAVKLPELPPPSIIDIASAAGTSAGTLDVTSSPPANVVLDGRPLGMAPRLVRVPPGTHTILFIHPLYGRHSLSVNVSAGRTTRASAEF